MRKFWKYSVDEGIVWIGISALMLFALVEYVTPSPAIVFSSALVGFAIGIAVQRSLLSR